MKLFNKYSLQYISGKMVLGVSSTLLLFIIIIVSLLVLTKYQNQETNTLSQAQESNFAEYNSIDFLSSAQLNDYLPDEGSFRFPESSQDANWYPSNPGYGKTRFRTAVFIPRDYLAWANVSLSDTEIYVRLSQQSQAAVDAFTTFADIGVQYDQNQLVIHSDLSLTEMLCYQRPANNCDNWNNLIEKARMATVAAGNDPSTHYILYIFGGAGVAGAWHDAAVIGDWGFSSLFGYSVPGCSGITCTIERFFYTVRHEIGHTFGMRWHPGRYPSYPIISIMQDGAWNNFFLNDHPGYPERYVVCQSSFNTGRKECAERFIGPNRPQMNMAALSGRVVIPNCTSYDTSKKVFLSRSPQGLGWGQRFPMVEGTLQSDGRFTISLTDQFIYGWQRGYALKVASVFPSPNPDFNQFVDGEPFHFNPNSTSLCDDRTGLNCQQPNNFQLVSGLENCAVFVTPTPTMTPSPTPTPTYTPTPTPTPVPIVIQFPKRFALGNRSQADCQSYWDNTSIMSSSMAINPSTQALTICYKIVNESSVPISLIKAEDQRLQPPYFFTGIHGCTKPFPIASGDTTYCKYGPLDASSLPNGTVLDSAARFTFSAGSTSQVYMTSARLTISSSTTPVPIQTPTPTVSIVVTPTRTPTPISTPTPTSTSSNPCLGLTASIDKPVLYAGVNNTITLPLGSSIGRVNFIPQFGDAYWSRINLGSSTKCGSYYIGTNRPAGSNYLQMSVARQDANGCTLLKNNTYTVQTLIRRNNVTYTCSVGSMVVR